MNKKQLLTKPVIPFFKELRKPVYPEKIQYIKKARSAGNDFCFTAGLPFCIPEDADTQIITAAQDLRSFCTQAGIKISIIKKLPDESIPCVSIVRGTGYENQPESFSITAGPNRIIIDGADSSGIMYGIYHCEELMKERGALCIASGVYRRKPILKTRILRSPMAFFHGDELSGILDAYPKHYLAKMSHHGYNGIWVRGKLHEMAKVRVFPEFGTNAEKTTADLNTFVSRAARFGIKVFIYFNEPLAHRKDSPFFKNHPDVIGEFFEPEDVYALCTSTTEVQEFLHEGMKYLFTSVQGLAGVILITASEFHTHCYSHTSTRSQPELFQGSALKCPRCKTRTPQEIIGEVVRIIRDGVRSGNPDAEVIAWNWSWSMYEEDPQSGVIAALPEGVTLMADYERGDSRLINGVNAPIDEYSLTFAGPSKRFKGTAAAARTRGCSMYSKLQVGTTHELGSVPYFPLYRNLAEKFIGHREQGISGSMESWNFGNILSPNTEIANRYSWDPLPENIDTFLRGFARRELGAAAADSFCRAWKYFSEASVFFPFSISFVYWGPQPFGTAYPLRFNKTGMHMPLAWLLPAEVSYNIHFTWMKYTDFGDDITNYLGPFTPEQIVDCFDKFLDKWNKGLALLKKAGASIPKNLRPNYVREYAVSAMAGAQFTSARNVTEFIHVRNIFLDEKNLKTKKNLGRKLITIAENEVKNARSSIAYCRAHPMLGWHGEAFWFDYSEKKILQKIKETELTVRQIRKELSLVK